MLSVAVTRRAGQPHVPELTAGSEFGGAIGCGLTVFALPLVVIALFHGCPGAEQCDLNGVATRLNDKFSDLSWLTAPESTARLLSASAVVMVWFAFQAVLYLVLPGEIADGVPLPDGSRLKYKLNGHLAFWISLLLAVCGPQARTHQHRRHG